MEPVRPSIREDVTAYATRFGQHLRSIVLDAPEGTPGLDAFELDGNEARSTARAVRLACARSPTCSPDHPDPDAEFAELTEAIRKAPLSGTVDIGGTVVQVTLDEAALLYLAARPALARRGARFDIVAIGTGRLPVHHRDVWRADF